MQRPFSTLMVSKSPLPIKREFILHLLDCGNSIFNAGIFQRPGQIFYFVKSLFVFLFRIGIGNYASSRLVKDPAFPEKERAYGDVQIEIAVKIDISYGTAVDVSS